MPLQRPLTLSTVAGLVLVGLAALMFLARLPGAYHALQHAAKAAAGRNELGGALATTDSLGLKDDFVRYAFAYVPKDGRFAVVLPRDEAAVEKAEARRRPRGGRIGYVYR